MKYSLIAVFMLGALASNLQAELKSVEYSFDSETNLLGVWAGSLDPWVISNNGGSLFVGSTWSASKYIAFTASGANFRGVASVANVGTPSSDSAFSLGFSFYSQSYWGTSAGLGSSAMGGISLGESIYSGGLFLELGTTSLGTASYSFASESWYDVRLDVDLSANSGAGSASAFIRLTSSSVWTSVASLTNVNLNLKNRGIDPTTWNTLWFHEEGGNSGIDNLSLVSEAVPEPTTWGALAMGGLLLFGNALRKRPLAGV